MGEAGDPVGVYLSLGSNIDPEANLRKACQSLRTAYGTLTLSPVYRTPAVGFDGDDFLNMVVGFVTTDSPVAIKARMEELHRAARRVRQDNPFSPRTLDADVLLYGSRVSPELKLPHPDIDRYPFVLRPLAEIAPELRHPVSGQTLRHLWERMQEEGDIEMSRIELDLG